MRLAVFGGIILLNFILQSTLFTYIEIFGAAPNTALLVVVSYAMLRGDVEGALSGFFAGLLVDIFFGRGVIGLFALLYAVIGFLCGKPFKDFIRENYLLPLILVIISSLALETVTFGALFALQGNIGFMENLRIRIMPLTVYTVLLTVPFYILIYRVNQVLERRGY